MDTNLMRKAIERAALREFKWGIDDCCLWVADIVLAHGGPDIAEPFRGYASRDQALMALWRYARGDLIDAAIKRAMELNFESASDGTLAVCVNEAGPVLAISWQGRFVARTEKGAAFLPHFYAIRAWRVPCLQ